MTAPELIRNPSSLDGGGCQQHLSYGYFTSVHVLVVNPREHLILPARATGGRETVLTLANRYDAVAAINGGFWKSNGDPAGVLKINHQWLGTQQKKRGAIGWSPDAGQVLIDRINTKKQPTTDSTNDIARIEVIPASSHTTSEEWKQMEYIVGGTPVLIKNGNLITDFSEEQVLQTFLSWNHPRTAVGIRENGDWVFVVVDGRFYTLLGGMSILELGKLMHHLGCIEALNLDGGNSSTMVIEGVVINDPHAVVEENGKYVQKVSDAILIF